MHYAEKYFLECQQNIERDLRMAIEIVPNKEYDLLMRPEVGSKKLFSWFFFSVLIKNGNEKNNENILKLNIINKPKDKNFYNGQCPVLMFDSSLNKWTRNTFNVYTMNNGIKNPNLIREMGKKSRQIAEQKFDINKVNGRLEKIILA